MKKIVLYILKIFSRHVIKFALYINNVKYEELLENQMMVDAIIRNIK